MRFDLVVSILAARIRLLGRAADARPEPAMTRLGNGYNSRRITSMDGLREFLGGRR